MRAQGVMCIYMSDT